MPRNERNVTIEDATIAFRNFSGKEDVYNREGDRNFAIILEHDVAAQMERDGWNIKYLKAREEGDEPQPYIQVKVSYKNRPPKIGMVTSGMGRKGKISYLTEAEVEMLDWVDIETVDVTLNPYEWAVNGRTGVSAYLQTLYIKIEEDYLQMKWESWIDDQRQIEGSPDYIDGEFEVHEDNLQIEGAR
jgi:hypothetical protein